MLLDFAAIEFRSFVAMTNIKSLGVAFAIVLLCTQLAHSASSVDDASAKEERLRQAEIQRREASQRQELAAVPAIHSQTPGLQARAVVVGELPCFAISRLVLTGPDALRFSWLQADFDPFAGHCLGARSIEALVLNLNDRLIQQGYVTSRVYAEPQALDQGVLRLALSVGRIATVKLKSSDAAADSRTLPWALRMALPSGGGVLNVRDLDQATETIDRMQGNKLSLFMEPGADPATSDILADWQQAPRWGLVFGVDNSSSPSMGRTRVNAQFRFDNLLGWADQLSMYTGSNAEQPGPGRRSLSSGIRYSIPWSYHRFTVSSSNSRSGQQVESTNTTFLATAHDQEHRLQWLWTFYRDGQLKLSTDTAIGIRRGVSHIADAELVVQRRNARLTEAGITLDWRGTNASLQATLSQSRATRLAHEDESIFRTYESPTADSRRTTGQLYWSIPWRGRSWQYSLQWDALFTQKASPLGDVVSLGGRYNVRGFTGDHPVVANDGSWLRQELQAPAVAWVCDTCAWAPYIGIDVGHLWGPSSVGHLRTRMGVTAGVRFYRGAFSAEVALSSPLRGRMDTDEPSVVPYLSASWAL
jgi:hemolysin activation/secretion protein